MSLDLQRLFGRVLMNRPEGLDHLPIHELTELAGKVQAQEVLSQASFYSVNDMRLHFGLGPVEQVDLEIRWPNGAKESLSKVAADQLITVREGSGIVKRERFGGK